MFAVLSRKVSAGLADRLALIWICGAKHAKQVTAVSQEQLRLRVLFAVAALKLFNFIGGAWDIQWHIEIGRDSLFIPPHMLVFLAFISGVALVLALIAYETALARTGQEQPHAARIGPFRNTGHAVTGPKGIGSWKRR